jgi:anti-anti-sigma factor
MQSSACGAEAEIQPHHPSLELLFAQRNSTIAVIFDGRSRDTMSELILKIEYAGDTARLECSGRIVAGAPCEELDAALQQLCREVAQIDLDCKQLTFLDSSGIGILVRNLVRARNQKKVLRLTSMSSRVRETLELTNVISQFASPRGARRRVLSGLRILFADPSAEVRTFAGAVLKDRGAQAETCASIYDVKLLASKTRVDLVIVPAEFDCSALPAASAKLLQLKKGIFSGSAEDAAESLIQQVNSAVASK